jgi:hypothetical protein
LIDAQSLIIPDRCRVAQGLLEIFRFEKRVLGEDRAPVRIGGKEFENAANRDPHPTNARLPAALSRLNRNPIKQIYRGHVLSLDKMNARVDHWRNRDADRWGLFGTVVRDEQRVLANNSISLIR